MSDSPLPGQVEEKEMQEMDPEKGATSGPISASSQSDVISTNNILASMPSKTSQWSGMSSRRRGRSARHRSARSSRGARPAVLDVEGQEQDQVDQLAEEIAEGKMAIRDIAKPMDTKREMLRRLEGKRIKGFGWRVSMQRRWKKSRENMHDFFAKLEVWRSPMHSIEGKFGTGILSYFQFMRWLLFLNLVIFLLMFLFILLPAVIFTRQVGTVASTNSTNSTESCEDKYVPYNVSLYQPTDKHISDYIVDVLQGKGIMEDTHLFYGFYPNTIQNIQETDGYNFTYNLPLAYLLTALSYFLISLVLMVRNSAQGLQESLVSSEDKFYTYCNKVFGGWDFCINDGRAADLKHGQIRYELKTDLEEQRILQKQAKRTGGEKCRLYTVRFVVNIFVLAILGAGGFLIYYASTFALEWTAQYGTATDTDAFVKLLVTYTPSLTITGLNMIVPIIFDKLVGFEDYSPEFEIQMTLLRTVFLRLASVATLLGTLYTQIACSSYADAECRVCDEEIRCWETYVGQEMYKLVIMDFLVGTAVTLFVEFPRKFIVSRFKDKLEDVVGYQEFQIPKNVLDIVYSQTLCWIGTFFAPMLPAICVIKTFIFFYLKKLSLMHNCVPSTKPFRASKSRTFFMVILLVSFLLCIIPVGIGIVQIYPSRACGPFRSLNTMFEIVTQTIAGWPTVVRDIFFFLGSAGFLVPAVLILCLLLYYFRALSVAHKKMVAVLKDQLILEGKDKHFLLQRVYELQGTTDPTRAKQNKAQADRKAAAAKQAPNGYNNESQPPRVPSSAWDNNTSHPNSVDDGW
ncbi:transmembrane channel-like protein 7 isoform X1 [Branchiostoma lanceolatum]|uniref:transmembrane channel-like protein 7 isoform X1 n=2 Tax=Branchiostoma lanceolatum TaxID=7740 RepID=UPI003451CDE2